MLVAAVASSIHPIVEWVEVKVRTTSLPSAISRLSTGNARDSKTDEERYDDQSQNIDSLCFHEKDPLLAAKKSPVRGLSSHKPCGVII